MSENRKPFETYAHYKIGKGFATLAVSVDEGHTRVGISYCHPRDGINKSYGRTVARARRDAGSKFSFSFQRDKDVRLGDQLREKFECFIAEAGEELIKVRQFIAAGLIEETTRVGAPPWAIHSLSREIRKREHLAALIDSVPEFSPEPVACVVTGGCC